MARRCPECLAVLTACAAAAIMIGGALLLGHIPALMGH
jgi:hypothetical protein